MCAVKVIQGDRDSSNPKIESAWFDHTEKQIGSVALASSFLAAATFGGLEFMHEKNVPSTCMMAISGIFAARTIKTCILKIRTEYDTSKWNSVNPLILNLMAYSGLAAEVLASTVLSFDARTIAADSLLVKTGIIGYCVTEVCGYMREIRSILSEPSVPQSPAIAKLSAKPAP